MAINIGDAVTVFTEPGFSDENGAPIDPAQVQLMWYVEGEPPTKWTWSGSDNQIKKTDLGKFSADIPIEKVGTYHFRWAGTGGVTAAEESSFVAESAFSG